MIVKLRKDFPIYYRLGDGHQYSRCNDIIKAGSMLQLASTRVEWNRDRRTYGYLVWVPDPEDCNRRFKIFVDSQLLSFYQPKWLVRLSQLLCSGRQEKVSILPHPGQGRNLLQTTQ